MIKTSLLPFVLFFSIAVFSQSSTIYVYDFQTGILDSLPPIEFDTTLTNAATDYSIGEFSSNVAMLSSDIPTDDVFPDSEFSLRNPVSESFEIQDYPIRTSVKISFMSDGELENCSGSMISKKHVLTGSYCFVESGNVISTTDMVTVSPIFNDGMNDPNFGPTTVTKIYFAKNFSPNSEFFAVLELSESIGVETGYIGVGFNVDQSGMNDEIFYKFTYPSGIIPVSEPNEFNGDTLFYFYGSPDVETFQSYGVSNATGFFGEGGGSMIKVENNMEYTSYGIQTFSSGLSHDKFSNQTFHNIKEIINDDLVLGLDESPIINYVVWPNPAINEINIDGIKFSDVVNLTIFDAFGKTISAKINGAESRVMIVTSDLASGMYFLHLETRNGAVTEKFVKL